MQFHGVQYCGVQVSCDVHSNTTGTCAAFLFHPFPRPTPPSSSVRRPSVVSCQLSIGRPSSFAVPVHPRCACPPPRPLPRRAHPPTMCIYARVCLRVCIGSAGYLQAITLPHRSRPIIRPTSTTNLDIRVSAVQDRIQDRLRRAGAARNGRPGGKSRKGVYSHMALAYGV